MDSTFHRHSSWDSDPSWPDCIMKFPKICQWQWYVSESPILPHFKGFSWLAYHLFDSAKMKIHKARMNFSFVYLSIMVPLCPLHVQFFVFGWQEWNPMWSFAIEGHLPTSLTRCAFWNAFQLTTVVKSGYLRYHGFFWQLEQVWPFSSDLSHIKGNSIHIIAVYWIFFGPFWVNC